MPDTVTVLVIVNDEDTIIDVFDTEEDAMADLREYLVGSNDLSDDEVMEAMNSEGQMTFVHTTTIRN